MIKHKEAKALLDKYIEGKCTPAEKAQVEKTYNLAIKPNLEEIGEERYAKLKDEIWNKINSKPVTGSFKLWPQLTAAAIVLVTMSIAGYFYFSTPSISQHKINHQYVNDVPAGSNKAILTLADGSKISLNEAMNGDLAKQQGVSILKTAASQLVYQLSNTGSTNSKTAFNTLETPRGGQHQVILPDGSKVWLNAASSIRFPTTFANNKSREVELKGEAYFEVAKDKTRPFIVKSGIQEITVLGTVFNISAYSDEGTIKTTLLEGSVKVNGLGQTKMLVPGQQLQLGQTGLNVTDKIDMEEVISWKKGYFKFNENLRSIMNKVSRWYDVEVIYEGRINEEQTFSGEIARSRNISALLKIMESTGSIQFKIEGRRVTIMQ